METPQTPDGAPGTDRSFNFLASLINGNPRIATGTRPTVAVVF